MLNYDDFGPDHKLHVTSKSNYENKNSKEEIRKIEISIYEYLKNIESAPGMPFHYVPDNYI